MIVYPLERLYQEMAYLAHHFHWPYEQIMAMDHYERQQWVRQIMAINTRWLPEPDDIVKTVNE